ncbi:uncharacterized protein LOC127052334 isoform X1 [Gopherus flavomarginatus]|uniref:uncharacterized protein LOC127052334 isoform X1 n=1 Tax=Gopherus flavomarginatus TaxID=286002 RepID=UPI0021CBF857|nr:uncharacterized protein LOC127052334 isoform X1 [Gopherus flavomarginatus]
MAWAEGTASGWVGGWVLVPLGGCLLLCGLCRRKLPVFPPWGPQPSCPCLPDAAPLPIVYCRDSPLELGPRYISDPTSGTSVTTSPQPPVGPRSTDNEDEDDFQYPPAPWTESRQTPVFESLKQARESGTDVDSHGSYVNINSEEDYVNLQGANGRCSVEKDKEYLEVLPLEAERTWPHRQKGSSHDKGENVSYANVDDKELKPPSLDEQKADYDYVNMS